MNKPEMIAVFTIAQDVLRSRSKFALFLVDLSAKLYSFDIARTPEAQAEYELFWKTTDPFRRIQGGD